MARAGVVSGGYTHLMIACEEGDLEKARSLLSSSNLNAKNQHGYTSLALAIKGGFLDLVKLLIDNGASPNAINNAGQSPLFLACWHNRPAIVQMLLDAKADVNLPDQRGWTPLMISAYHDFEEVAGLLLRHGCNVEHRDCVTFT